MSVFDQPVDSPTRLADVPDPCTEMFHAVRCTRPATKNLHRKDDGRQRRVCDVHARAYAYRGSWTMSGSWTVTR
jgi:hypothetical protein